ncbi:hypothetical protein Tco_1413141, partial [Tanacetum coccineum]
SLINQFWQTAALCIIDDGVLGITATIDRKVKITVSEASNRRHLKLEDSEGIPFLLTTEIFEQLALIGYVTTSDSLTFQKGHFSPQWKFFIHTILHCLSPKKTAWEQFSSNIATAIICLATNRTFNFSKFIFDAMVKNLDSTHKCLITPSTSQPPITSTKEAAPMPHELHLQSVHSLGCNEGSLSQNELMDLVTKLTDRIGVLEKDLQQTKKTYSTALTRLILRVKKLEKNVKTGKARRRARIVISEDEDAVEDSFKQGRKISDIDTDPTISLVQPQQDMEYDFDVSTAEGFSTASIPVTTAGLEISTANIAVSTTDTTVTTASASISTVSPPRVSTTEDISESEPPKKIKKRVQVQVSIDEELAKKVFEEEQAKAKAEQEQQKFDFEIALELQRQLDEREEVELMILIGGGYKLSHFKGIKYEDIRPIFERVWDQNQAFVPMDSENEKGSEKKIGGRRKKSLTRKRAKEILSEESAKKQKLEYDDEKEELQVYLNIVPEEESLDVESLATKQDMLELYRLVKDRFQTATPEGYDLLLWGDLKTLIKPNEEDEIWRNQQD